MDKGQTETLIAVTVTGCQAAAAADGVAIVVQTAEAGRIAFGVDQRTIQALRAALTKAEEYFSHQGRA
jgi:hypothetical protein